MIIDVEQAKSIEFDVCIIGGGPTGIILALEHAEKNPLAKVLLLECGKKGTTTNPLDETVRVTNLQNHYAPYDCTNKGIGGSSISWGGRCVMYDEIDFLPHGAVQEQCTWTPQFFEDVKPYLKQTCRYFLCGDDVFDAGKINGLRDWAIAENFRDGTVSDKRLERWSLPTRFGKEYKSKLTQSKTIHVLSGYYAFGFSGLDTNGRATFVDARAVDGEITIRVSASKFVICAGGHETTRLLLKSPQLFSRLGGAPTALGKFYQGHISGKVAHIKFFGDPDKTEYGFFRDAEGVYCRRRFQLETRTLIESGVLNTAFWLDNPPYYDATHGNGVMSFIYLVLICPVLKTRLLPPAIWKSITSGRTVDVKKHVLNVLKGLPGSLLTPAAIFASRYLRRRSLPGVFLRSDDNRYSLHFHAEQVPREENRMELGPDGEELIIRFGYSNEDVESVIRAHRILDEHLQSIGCGKLEYDYKESELAEVIEHSSIDGTHQAGTTRIGDTPASGVVDTDLRVWGTENVYVCSSSVFPTSSQANPTLFMGACAVRLAHHLGRSESISKENGAARG